MKKILPIILVVLIYACETKESRWQMISKKQAIESEKGIKNDTIFLDFRFGMTQNEVNNHFKKLLSEGKITKNSKNQYQYKFVLDEYDDADAAFQAWYFNDSLYSLTLRIEDYSSLSAGTTYYKLAVLLMNKYPNLMKVESIMDKRNEDYIWIDGNRQILLHYPVGSIIILNYTDWQIEDRKQQFDREQKQLKKQESIEDL